MFEPYQSDRPGAIHGFECDEAAALAVERAVNGSHSTTAQHALDVIAFNAGPARVGSVRNSIGATFGVSAPAPVPASERSPPRVRVVACGGRDAASSMIRLVGGCDESPSNVESVSVTESFVRRASCTSN